MKILKIKLIKDCDVIINDFTYKKGQEIEAVEITDFPNAYAIYHNLKGILDWIPRDITQMICEVSQ